MPAKEDGEKTAKTVDQILANERTKRKAKIGTLSQFNMETQALTTGNILVDAITGVGGLPRGRITELYGLPSSGKTTTALQLIAAWQPAVIESWDKTRRYCLILDYEKSFDPTYLKALGIDAEHDSFIYYQPTSFEDGANLFRRLMDTGELDILLVDSVAMMVTENELASETGKATVADRPKMMAQFMRQVVDPISRHKVCAIFLNHVQEIIDASPMGQRLKAQGVNRKTTPGGASLKFNASMRLEFKQVGNIRSKIYDEVTNSHVDVIQQTKVQVNCMKNKVAEPFRQAEVRVRYGKGFSQAHAVLQVLIDHKVIKLSTGGVHRVDNDTAPKGWDFGPDGKKDWIKGEDNFVSMLEADAEWLSRLTERAHAALAAAGGLGESETLKQEAALEDALEKDALASLDELLS